MSTLRDDRSWHPTTNRLVVLDQSSWQLIDFGTSRAAQLAAAQGWSLEVIRVRAAQEPGAWTAAMLEAVTEDAAAVMLGSYFVSDHVEAMQALHRSRSSALAYSIYAPSVPEFRDRLGAAADGVLWATTTGTYSDQMGLSFARRFQQRFHVTPGRSHAGIAYDRTHIIAQGWSRSDDFRDFDTVADRIRRTTYRGVNGSYYLDTPSQTAQGFTDSSGDPSLAQAHLIYQVQHGHQHIVSPAPYTTSRFQLPPWVRLNADRAPRGDVGTSDLSY
jgi:branched-chain amino acid transport system substrate-binding protein